MNKYIRNNLSPKEIRIFEKLKTPQKIQDYINSLAMRDDTNEPIIRSPRHSIIKKEISCIEGALLACALLKYHGYETYLLDLKVDTKNNKDCDHVVAIFKTNEHFGAISKTSHSVLRYREPIYRTIRELAMTYFHEYFLDDGKKTLRSFSQAFPLFEKFGIEWITNENDLYNIGYKLDTYSHERILTPKMLRNLRKAEPIEIAAGKIKL